MKHYRIVTILLLMTFFSSSYSVRMLDSDIPEEKNVTSLVNTKDRSTNKFARKEKLKATAKKKQYCRDKEYKKSPWKNHYQKQKRNFIRYMIFHQ